MLSTRRSTLVLLLAVACVDSSRRLQNNVADAVAKQVGAAAAPRVGFLNDSTHLLISVATVAFRTRPDSEVTIHARGIARVAFLHYARSAQLDSITVNYVEKITGGASWIRHSRSYAVATLRKPSPDTFP